MNSKNTLVALIALVLATTALTFALPVEETWTGEISDSICRVEHQPISEGDPVLPAPECTKVCVRGGSKYVFVSGEKVYDLDDQKNIELEKFAGQPIRLTGVLKDNSIAVSKIEAAGR